MSDKHDWQALSVEIAMNAKKNLDAKDDEITRLQSEVERLRGRCGELEDVCVNVHRDLSLRSEPDWDDKNVKVVNLSAGYWDDLCRVVDSAQRLRQQAAESEGGEV